MNIRYYLDNPLVTYRRLFGYIRKYFSLIVVSFVGYALYAATYPLAAEMIKVVTETIENPTPAGILLVSVAPLALALVQGLGFFLGDYFMAKAGQFLVYDMRANVFAHILRLPVSQYHQNATGHLMSKVTYDSGQVMAAGTTALTTIFKEGLVVIGLLIYLLYKYWQLTLILLLVVPVIALIINKMSSKFRKISRRKQLAKGNLTQYLSEAIDGHQPVKIFSAQEQEEDRFGYASNKFVEHNLRLRRGKISSTVLVQLVVAAGIGIIIFLYMNLMDENISVGDFLAFITAVGLLQKPLKSLTKVNYSIQQGITGAASVFDMLDRPLEPDEGQQSLDRCRGELAFEHVCFGYTPDSPVIQDLSFHINPGEVVALVGRSGAGKSTIAALVPRFYDPDEGRILLDGHPLPDYRLTDLRHQVSMVTQKVVLFNGSIRENIAYGELRGASDEEIIEAAKAAYAWDFIETLPNGLDTRVGQDGIALSGGQRQRVAIARALLKDSPILILDEATSALDNESEHFIQKALERVMQGRTTLVIAHRLSTIEKADRILVLNEGCLMETGNHQELLARDGLYAQMYRMNFEEQ